MAKTRSKTPVSDQETAAAALNTCASHGSERTRDLLLEAGKKVFARKGYDGATVKDIADEAGVNISLVSYHFQGKEGLFRACVEQFGQSRLLVAQRLLRPPASREELRVRIQMFIEEVLGCFKDEPDLTRMIMHQLELGAPVVHDIFESTFLKVYQTLCEFLQTSLDQGILRADVDPKFAASFLFGNLSNIARMETLNRTFFNSSIADPTYRQKLVSQLMLVFFEGTSHPKTPDNSTSKRSK